MSSTFDYIIIGGGTAGSVLASRLSIALPQCTFLAIEAGPDGDPRIEPTQGYFQGMDPNIEWDHRSVPQRSLNGKTVAQAQGKIMGGSSAINVQGWTRGPSVDFDQWAALVDDQRWSWAGLLPYFKRSETFYPSPDQTSTEASAVHGFDGPIKISHSINSGKPRNYPLRKAIQQAYDSYGLSRISDHNSGKVLGYAEVQMNTRDGKRYWAANYKFEKNVTTWTKTVARKLVFEGKRAVSVQVCRNSGGGSPERINVSARKEILLTSGVQGSAKLLLLSGIGPVEELKKHSIPQICDLPVGENYSDHPFLQTFWKLRDQGQCLGDMPFITDECDWTAGIPTDWMAWHQHKDIIDRMGKDVVDRSSVEWLSAEGKAHTESFFLYGHLDMAHAGIAHPGGSCIAQASLLLTPTSRGTVALQSADPKDAPLLDPNLLGNKLDRKLLLAVAKTAIEIMQGPVGQKLGVQEYGIDEVIRNDTSEDALMTRWMKTGRTCNHGSGTCAMGSVVDSECRVKGIERLRVVDASVFPFPIAAHYQAAVYAVAEQMAQVIIDGQTS